MARKGKGPAAAAPAEAETSENNDNSDAPEVTESSADDSTNDTNDAAGDTTKPSEEEKKDAPEVNGKADESTDDEGKKKKKKIKKSVPEWATLSESAKKTLPKSQMAKPKVQDAIIAAINAHGGTASAGSIKSFVMADNPDLPKMVLKKGVLKAIERGLIKQVKGKGFSGSFKLETAKKAAKAKAKDAKKSKAKTAPSDKLPLDSVFPSVFTWATNPKEASVGLIRKYITKHYPDLDVDGQAFKKAIEGAEKKGQLKRITGKGFSGTFELVDGAEKTGSKYEDAIENAIISMNEPKQISVNALRDYLSCWHAEYNTDNRPLILKKALDRCSEKGWLQQISGKGFSGTYRLMYPYYPSPRELWGEYYEGDKKKKDEKKESPKKAAKRPAPVEDSEDEEEDFSDEEPEYTPRKGPRGAPKARSAVVAKPKKKVAAKKPQKKTQKPTGKKTKAKKQKKK